MTSETKCPWCKKEKLAKKSVLRTYTYRSHSTQFVAKHSKCAECGRASLSRGDFDNNRNAIQSFQNKVTTL